MLLLLNKVRQERLGDPLFNTWGRTSFRRGFSDSIRMPV